MATKKKIILHPANPVTGEPILDVELYPETLKTGIVNSDGTSAIDTTVTEGSGNLITSGAVKTYVEGTEKILTSDNGFCDINGHNVLKTDASTEVTLGSEDNNTSIKGDEIYITPSNNGKARYKGQEVGNAMYRHLISINLNPTQPLNIERVSFQVVSSDSEPYTISTLPQAIANGLLTNLACHVENTDDIVGIGTVSNINASGWPKITYILVANGVTTYATLNITAEMIDTIPTYTVVKA